MTGCCFRGMCGNVELEGQLHAWHAGEGYQAVVAEHRPGPGTVLAHTARRAQGGRGRGCTLSPECKLS